MKNIDFDNDELVEVEFTATIKLWRDLDVFESDAEGDITQAVQNVIGHTGANVESAEEI